MLDSGVGIPFVGAEEKVDRALIGYRTIRLPSGKISRLALCVVYLVSILSLRLLREYLKLG